MAFTKIYDQLFEDFQGEYWGGVVEWYGPPQPLDLRWVVQDVVSFYVGQKGGTLFHVAVYQEQVFQIGGFDVLNHYVMYYDHHIVPAAIASAILTAITVALVVVIVYLIYQALNLLFRGSPECYVPASSGQCRSGYVWDSQKQCEGATGACVAVTAPIDWMKALAAVVVVGGGAFALYELVQLVRKK